MIGGRYRIVSPLGEGGIGTVLIAEHVELGRRVALKVLQERIGSEPTMRKRFEREARTLAAMSHPNIVAINDYGIWESTPYLVMELLAGRTLAELLQAEPMLPLDRALGIAQQILRALAYAHAQGVIHRDLKPGNVFLQALPDDVDHVKLLDFGFAKFVGQQPVSSIVSADGIVVGTPAYMAPEQAGGRVDHRADVYAAGVLVFEMVTGRRPFEGDALEMIRGRLMHDAPSMRAVRPDLDLPPALESAVARALQRRPEDRFQSAAELSSALGELKARASRPDASAPSPSLSTPDAPSATRRPAGDASDERAPVAAPRTRRAVSPLWVLLALTSVGGLGYAAWRVSGVGATGAADPLSWIVERHPAADDAPATAGPIAEGPIAEPEPPPDRAAVAVAEVPAEAALPAPEASPLASPALIIVQELVPVGSEALPAEAPLAEAPGPLDPSAAAADAPQPPSIAQAAVDEGARDTGPIAPAESPPESAPPVAHAPTATQRPADPWDGEVPPALLALRAHIDDPNHSPTEADLQRIGLYARQNPGDARAIVLLAHGYVRARWMTEALARYAEAHAADPAIRGDPHMLENLVALSRSPVVGAHASELVTRIYGREALAAVNAALAAPGVEASELARLNALRDAIAALP